MTTYRRSTAVIFFNLDSSAVKLITFIACLGKWENGRKKNLGGLAYVSFDHKLKHPLGVLILNQSIYGYSYASIYAWKLEETVEIVPTHHCRDEESTRLFNYCRISVIK